MLSGKARDFHELSWLFLNLKKQKSWTEMVIFLHLIISNKNLLQPPACLQDFLFCLTTSIFKLAEFLSVGNCHSHWHTSQFYPALDSGLRFLIGCDLVAILCVFLWFLHSTCCVELTDIREQNAETCPSSFCLPPGYRAHWIFLLPIFFPLPTAVLILNIIFVFDYCSL